VLVLTAGKFGERWMSLQTFDVGGYSDGSAGSTLSLDDVRGKPGSEIRCVYVQATESSGAGTTPAIAKLVRALPDTLLIVDESGTGNESS
jgi:aspartate aminotransferase-like enzyme